MLHIPSVNLSLFLVSCVTVDCDFQILQVDLICVYWENQASAKYMDGPSQMDYQGMCDNVDTSTGHCLL